MSDRFFMNQPVEAERVPGLFLGFDELHHFPVSESINQAEQDPFVRALLLAEDMEVLKAAARNEGDAARAAQYSEIETFLLRAAAGIQAANDQKAEGQ